MHVCNLTAGLSADKEIPWRNRATGSLRGTAGREARSVRLPPRSLGGRSGIPALGLRGLRPGDRRGPEPHADAEHAPPAARCPRGRERRAGTGGPPPPRPPAEAADPSRRHPPPPPCPP